MDQQALNQRCVELMSREAVRAHMWHAPLFWHTGNKDNPSSEELTKPRVDLCELEVMLSAAAGEPSQCAEELNARSPGRADFITRSVRRGERPLLTPL